MCEGEERMSALSARLETCHVPLHQIAGLESFQRLVCRRHQRSSKTAETKLPKESTLGAKLYMCCIYKVTQGRGLLTKRLILSIVSAVLAIGIALVLHLELHTHHGFARVWFYWENVDLQSEQCTVEMPSMIQDTFRPPVNCTMCKDMKRIDRVKDIHPSLFGDKYAYSGRPVVVVDGQRDWSAVEVFSLDFFRSVYGEEWPVPFHVERECQFFPYLTSFNNLKQLFNTTRQQLDTLHWYIGWSNCDSWVASVLREHYERPYFLPAKSEASKTDWIFMGTPGQGAHLHIDHVGNPSWQAQIRGRKRWVLEPPPECYFQCSPLQVIVNPGEIIVLNTNIWYHGTSIMPGELSISIGSEYD